MKHSLPAESRQHKEADRTAHQDASVFFSHEGGEALEQVGQRNCGCAIPGSVQDRVGWGFEQPRVVAGDPADGREGWTR